VAATVGVLALALPIGAATSQLIPVHAAGFQLGKNVSATTARTSLNSCWPMQNPPRCRSSVCRETKFRTGVAGAGSKTALFHVRFAMPIPPEKFDE